MPRVKAMTTGSIPSFLDVILNFAESDTSSTLATQDTWLAQLRALDGGRLVMYGDDTWLKLFPGFFARADGTSSFFVSVSGRPLLGHIDSAMRRVVDVHAGLHRGGCECDEACAPRIGAARLERYGDALPGIGSYWA